jgi:uncharacterized protein YjbJ (UPF0337 family)
MQKGAPDMGENQIKGAAKDAVSESKNAVGGLTGDTSVPAERKLDQTSGNLQDQVGAAKDQLGSMANNVTDKISDMAGRAGNTMRDAAQTVRREAGEVGEKVYHAGARAGHHVDSAVKQQPLLSLIGVAAIGYAISFLIHSPSSPLASRPPKTHYVRG